MFVVYDGDNDYKIYRDNIDDIKDISVLNYDILIVIIVYHNYI